MNFLNNREQLYVSPNIRCIKRNGKIYLIFENDRNRQVPIEKLTFEDKIELFKDTIEGWYFKPIEQLLNLDMHDDERFFKGVVILQSLIPIVELVGQVLKGEFSYNRSSFNSFKEGMQFLFKLYFKEEINSDLIYYFVNKYTQCCDNHSHNDKIMYLIYNHLRNGLCHNAIFKVGVKFSFYYKRSIEILIKNSDEWKRTNFSKFKDMYPSKILENFQVTIKVNPKLFFEELKEGFEILITDLKKGNYKDTFPNIFGELHGKLKTCNFLGVPQRGG